MAGALDLRVVAEGIEHDLQLAHLRDHHCPLGQGHLFARPLPASELGVLLARGIGGLSMTPQPA